MNSCNLLDMESERRVASTLIGDQHRNVESRGTSRAPPHPVVSRCSASAATRVLKRAPRGMSGSSATSCRRGSRHYPYHPRWVRRLTTEHLIRCRAARFGRQPYLN